MHDRRVRGVDAPLQRLKPVALLHHLRHHPVILPHLRPGEVGERRLLILRPHVHPHNPAPLHRRIRTRLDLRRELLRLVHLINALTRHVELPPVVHATEAVLLVAGKPQRRQPVRTVLVEYADAPARVPERDEVLAHKPHAHGRAIGSGQLPVQQRRNPIPAQHVAHRRAWPHSRQQLVLLLRKHLKPPGNARPPYTQHTPRPHTCQNRSLTHAPLRPTLPSALTAIRLIVSSLPLPPHLTRRFSCSRHAS